MSDHGVTVRDFAGDVLSFYSYGPQAGIDLPVLFFNAIAPAQPLFQIAEEPGAPLGALISAPDRLISGDLDGQRLTMKEVATDGGVRVVGWAGEPGIQDKYLEITNLRIELDTKAVYGDVKYAQGGAANVHLWDSANVLGANALTLTPGLNIMDVSLSGLMPTADADALFKASFGLTRAQSTHVFGGLRVAVSMSAVPEPSTCLLTLLGLAGAGAMASRRRA